MLASIKVKKILFFFDIFLLKQKVKMAVQNATIEIILFFNLQFFSSPCWFMLCQRPPTATLTTN
jgi:hypothetical protein